MRSETWREEVTNGCLLLAAQNFLFFIGLKPAPWHLTPQTPRLTFLPVLWKCFICLSRQGNVPKKDAKKHSLQRHNTQCVTFLCFFEVSPSTKCCKRSVSSYNDHLLLQEHPLLQVWTQWCLGLPSLSFVAPQGAISVPSVKTTTTPTRAPNTAQPRTLHASFHLLSIAGLERMTGR